jgi:AcrR family transcriptional regulator
MPSGSGASASPSAKREVDAQAIRREVILRAALELFAERGYKETTATQIAERAGISRRLFFYYFPSKDDILFAVNDRALALLRGAVRAQPPELSDLEAVAAAWKTFRRSEVDGGEGPERHSVVVQLRQAAAGSPLLRGKEYELHLAYQDAVAHGLAERRGLAEPDRSALTAAAIGQTLMHLVVDRWLLDGSLDREQLIDEQFAAAATVLGVPAGHATG